MSSLANVCRPFILIIESTLCLWGPSERNKILGVFSSICLRIIEMQMDGRGMVAEMLLLFQLPCYLWPSDFWHFSLKCSPLPKSVRNLNCTVAHCQSSHWLGIKFPVSIRVKNLFSVNWVDANLWYFCLSASYIFWLLFYNLMTRFTLKRNINISTLRHLKGLSAWSLKSFCLFLKDTFDSN